MAPKIRVPKTRPPKHVPGQRDLFGRVVAPDSPLPVALLTPAEAVVAKAQARAKALGGGNGNWGPCILSGLVWQLRLDVSRLRLPYQPKTTCTHVPNPGSATETAAAAVDDGAMVEAELTAMLDADEEVAKAAAAEPMEISDEVVDVDEAPEEKWEEWQEWPQDWRSDDAAKETGRL